MDLTPNFHLDWLTTWAAWVKIDSSALPISFLLLIGGAGIISLITFHLLEFSKSRRAKKRYGARTPHDIFDNEARMEAEKASTSWSFLISLIVLFFLLNAVTLGYAFPSAMVYKEALNESTTQLIITEAETSYGLNLTQDEAETLKDELEVKWNHNEPVLEEDETPSFGTITKTVEGDKVTVTLAYAEGKFVLLEGGGESGHEFQPLN